MKAKPDAEAATLGRPFMREPDQANAFSELSRYGATIWQSVYKALHELQRLQVARRTECHLPPLIALDDGVSGISGAGV